MYSSEATTDANTIIFNDKEHAKAPLLPNTGQTSFENSNRFDEETANHFESLPPKPYRNNAPPNNFCCFYSRNTNWKQMPDRRIHPLVQDTSLPNNSIQTSKYTWLTFIPINLWEQFSQLANIYFLVSSSRIKNLSTL